MADDSHTEGIVVDVPSKGTISQREWGSRLVSLLSSMGIACELNQEGAIEYPDGPEGAEGELIIGLTRLFDARFQVTRDGPAA